MSARLRLRTPLAHETALAATIAAGLGAILLWLGPPGVDVAAHAYQRTLLLQHGFVLWNNFWYAGRYSFVTYSLLYYPLAAIVGIKLLGLFTVAASAAAFTSVVSHEWGTRARAASLAFAVIWTGIILSGAFPFALGIALALLALRTLQQRQHRLFALLVLLTLLASPLAFALLLIVLCGATLQRRPSAATVGAIAAAIVVELALRRVFPGGGQFPFSVGDFVVGVLFCVFGIVATARLPRAKPLLGLFSVFLAAIVVAYVVPSDVGSNVERLKYAAIPLAVLVVALTPRLWSKRLLVVLPLVGVAAAWNIVALAHTIELSASDPAGTPAYWQPAIAFLREHLTPSYRVEAVDTHDHWPAAYLPDAGIPIVRGWYRQNDWPENKLLYDSHLREVRYRRWLLGLGVRYVVLTDAPPDYSSRGEDALLRQGRSGLVPVFRSRHVTIYEVPNARAIVTGPGLASILWTWPSRMVLIVGRPGRYRVALRWSPYWRSAQGCVARGTDGMVNVTTPRAGLIDLKFDVDVGSSLKALAGVTPKRTCG